MSKTHPKKNGTLIIGTEIIATAAKNSKFILKAQACWKRFVLNEEKSLSEGTGTEKCNTHD